MRMPQMMLASVVLALVTLVANSSMAAPVLYGFGNTNINNAINRSFLYTINTTTGAATLVGDTGFNLRGLAYNPVTGRAYGSRAEIGGVGGLYEINLATGAATFIGGTQNFAKMEFDGSGNLFGYTSRVDAGNNFYDFFSINANTGVGTLLNSSALDFNHAFFDITYSSADNAMYYYQRYFNGSGAEGLSTVNTANGTLTSVVVVGGTFQGNRPDIAADDSGNIYANDRGFTSTLYTLNKTTGLTTAIGSNGVSIVSMAFTSDAVVSTPEPATMALLGLTGLAGLGLRLRRR